MKKYAYRRAVRSVRWSEAQRQAIEARLRAPAADPDYEDDSLFEAEVSVTLEELNEQEEQNMKHRPKKYLWVTAAAAAVLAAGGISAAVAMRGVQQEESFHLNLTDQTDEPSAHGIEYMNHAVQNLAESPTGYYFIREEVICYADRETGTVLPLCSRPQCLHDGNLYCTASTKAYCVSNLLYYDGAVYALATKDTQPDQPNGDPSALHTVLLRYEPDGSAITELHDFGIGWNNELGSKLSEPPTAPILHRGYIWCAVPVRNVTGAEVEHPITHEKHQFVNGGWQLWGYELATGKTVELYESVPEPDIDLVYSSAVRLFGIGDDLYFVQEEQGFSNNQGCYRISLLTGECTQTSDFYPYSAWCAGGDYLIYVEKFFQYEAVNLVTDEVTSLNPDMRKTMGFDCLTDGTYIYAFTQNPDNPMPENTESAEYLDRQICVYDIEGNLLQHRALPVGRYLSEMALIGGKLYLRIEDTEYPAGSGAGYLRETFADGYQPSGRNFVVYLSTDDLINGIGDWQTAFEYYSEGEAGAAQ